MIVKEQFNYDLSSKPENVRNREEGSEDEDARSEAVRSWRIRKKLGLDVDKSMTIQALIKEAVGDRLAKKAKQRKRSKPKKKVEKDKSGTDTSCS